MAALQPAGTAQTGCAGERFRSLSPRTILLSQATDVIERRLTEENPGFVSIVAMVETVWVLYRAYGLGPLEIARAAPLDHTSRAGQG
jgi:hypothetical protein